MQVDLDKYVETWQKWGGVDYKVVTLESLVWYLEEAIELEKSLQDVLAEAKAIPLD